MISKENRQKLYATLGDNFLKIFHQDYALIKSHIYILSIEDEYLFLKELCKKNHYIWTSLGKNNQNF